MARLDQRRPENVHGDVYVDESCIDCDTCRWMAPETFDRAGAMSRVHHQPADDEARHRALMALLACPTQSIGTRERHPLGAAMAAFPDPISVGPDGVGVYHCGYHAAASFGAASYLLVRPAGNVLMDSPRFNAPLVKRLEALGGVRWMVLSHQDDLADHGRFAAHFGCERLLHAADDGPGAEHVEHRPEGFEPFVLDAGDAGSDGPDDSLTVIPVPGHTRGSVCLQWRDVLFTGDHVWMSSTLGHLATTRAYCQHDWEEQRASMRRLAERCATHPFRWVLPGHGRRAELEPAEMAAQLHRAAEWMATSG